jgi:Fic family protein
MEVFTKPSGKIIKHDKGYSFFLPNKLPPVIEYDEGLVGLISEACLQLGNLSGIGKLIPNPHLLITPYIVREAVLSSKIEGTQATILDVFNFGVGGSFPREDYESKRVVEVTNYVKALKDCLDAVTNRKNIDIEMLTNAHKILMKDVRGQELNPGELRKAQNFIGRPGSKIQDARYVPPSTEYVEELLKNLEDFIRKPPGRIPVLVQCAMIHYMFEAIHPFLDGNGRIGRLLISLLFAERKLLDQPLLYLSAYFERNKTEYYSLLLQVSQNSDWVKWIRFFLHGVISQATDAVENIQKLLSLKMEYEERLDSKGASRNASKVVELLFSNPIVSIPSVAKSINVTYRGVKKNIDSLKAMNILKDYFPRHGKQHEKKFIAYEIVSILSH